MSLNIPHITPTSTSSGEATELSISELSDYSPNKKLTFLYHMQIEDIKKDRQRIIDDNIAERQRSLASHTALEEKLEKLQRYKTAHARAFSAKVETTIQLVVSTGLNGLGAAMMAIYPRSASAPWQFWVGVGLVASGLVIGLIVKPCALLFCKQFPSWLDDGLREE